MSGKVCSFYQLLLNMEEEMATHSSILAWKIAWTEKPGGLQFMESQRVGHKHVCLHKITLMCEIKAADLR